MKFSPVRLLSGRPFLTSREACYGAWGFSACIALFGLNEWLNPRSPQITGRLAWLYKYAEAHWGPTGPGISILVIAFLFFVLGLMLWCRAARQSTLDLHPGEHHDLY